MDWFSWLSKTDLDPCLVYEYALTFTHNELGQDDIAYFSHEFLQSMGVSIAKHRLEILKLARKNKGMRTIHPILWLMFAVKQTRKYVVKHIQALLHHQRSPLLVVPSRNHSLRWKVSMLQRNKRLRAPLGEAEWPRIGSDSPRFVSVPGILMLTNGSPMAGSQSSGSTQSSIWVESEANAESGHITTAEALANPWNSSFSRTSIHSPDMDYWSSSTVEIKWDSMFKNLKPT
ncbi:uncharacterized protein LOC125189000 [Salvia hispanica]|uniref:uncharacterized protein LOC125189000 n=1 Tax=Salvia hispanica TaxID=49212 RepID=UPI0020095507|nr:uncharacterized protein LOC125189000 [Salvia hispanica]